MQEVTCQMPPPPRKGLALLKENWSTAFNLRGYWFYETLSTKKKLVCYGIVWFSVTTQASKVFTFNANRMSLTVKSKESSTFSLEQWLDCDMWFLIFFLLCYGLAAHV